MPSTPTTPTVSVVIVSRDRPLALDLCLTGVAQLDYPAFEVVVVACPRGCAQVADRRDAGLIKLIPYDEPNISAARNRGVAQAAGEIVAFIDDDAVPEPTWLHHLTQPFVTPEVAAAGGYVRGRNGISFQWKARSVDHRGNTADLDLGGDAPRVLSPAEGRAIKLEGTNMALRRDLLAEIGGFDPGFRFYLDETDLNMRLARAGHLTAIVPLAQVHHGYGASVRRGRDRTPRDLREIGASQMLFLRKHCPEADRQDAWDHFRAQQRLRLLRLMQTGPLAADDVAHLLRGLERGRRDGLARSPDSLQPLPRAARGFLARPAATGEAPLILGGWVWQRRRLRQQALSARTAGRGVTLILLSPTALYHRVRFRAEGWWEQTGGVYGRSLRSQPLLRIQRLRSRLREEVNRLRNLRFLTD
ncbi:glycosyltransferase family 2 protein [Puniceibacterium confluentis]|uniref:glycosyltransferase family 2 protein n=1 Tax=Puniceibacterium confluentis TaxID=1958944 RepID=UPI0011B7CB94|nr:glycosyltransferase [Puniceibacterium confluentis]